MPTTPHPYVWFAKFANTRPQPELAVMRFANNAIGNKPRHRTAGTASHRSDGRPCIACHRVAQLSWRPHRGRAAGIA